MANGKKGNGYAVVVVPAPGGSVLLKVGKERLYLSPPAAKAIATRILGVAAALESMTAQDFLNAAAKRAFVRAKNLEASHG